MFSIVIFIAGSIVAPLKAIHIPLSVVGYICLVVSFIRGKRAKLERTARKILGRRGKSRIILRAGEISCAATGRDGQSETFTISRESLRRLRLYNTFDQSDVAGQPDIYVAHLAFAPIMIGQEIRRRRVRNIQPTCYALFADFQNTSATLADGMDELTARNLFEDVSRDLQRVAVS
jgi:hypothetical protein